MEDAKQLQLVTEKTRSERSNFSWNNAISGSSQDTLFLSGCTCLSASASAPAPPSDSAQKLQQWLRNGDKHHDWCG